MTLDDIFKARLSRNQRLRGFAFLLVLFTGVEGYYLALPRWNAYQNAQNALQNLEQNTPAKHYQASDVAEKIDEVNRINAEATLQRERFPVAESVSTLLIELERMTRDHKVEIRSFLPTRIEPFEGATGSEKIEKAPALSLLEQMVEVQAGGSFIDILNLLRSLERFRYPLGIQQLEIAPNLSMTDSEDPKDKKVSKDSKKAKKEGQATETMSLPPNQLGLKLVFSAYLLDKNPLLPTVDPLAKRWLPEAQLHAGQPNPFKQFATPAPMDIPDLPALPVVAATPDPIMAWHLDGLFEGPGKTAIVSDGQGSCTVSPGDLLEGWKVRTIDEDGITLSRNGKRRRLSLPKPVLPPGSQVSD